MNINGDGPLRERAAQLFMEGLAIFAPDGTSMCVVHPFERGEEKLHVGLAFEVWWYYSETLAYARRYSISAEILIDEQDGQVYHLGLEAGERMAMAVGAVMAGWSRPDEAYNVGGVLVKAREWKPGNFTTWIATMHPEMRIEFEKRKYEAELRRLGARM